MSDELVNAIRLFQGIINGHQRVGGKGVDGVVDVGRLTHRWLQAINAPSWQLMPRGSLKEGFINSERIDRVDKHDFGTSWMAECIRRIATRYRTDYLENQTLAAPLGINDVSLPYGGNSPDHRGHETGLACDLRLPRRSGKVGYVTITNPHYDRQAARAMVLAVHAEPLVSRVLFNDPELVRDSVCQAVKGHHNHIHFEINPPAIQEWVPSQ
jgi:hypothetical protein